MKGTCHIWSRGRLISPSLPVGDDWYLNLSSQKRSPGRNLGEHRSVRRSGTASRGTALLVFGLRMRSFPRTEVLTIFLGINVRLGSSKFQIQSISIYVCKFTSTCAYASTLNDTVPHSSKSCFVKSSSISFFYNVGHIVLVDKESRLITN